MGLGKPSPIQVHITDLQKQKSGSADFHTLMLHLHSLLPISTVELTTPLESSLQLSELIPKMGPGKSCAPRLLRHKLIYHPDFGPGHLPTSASQGVESTYVLALWGMLTDDRRALLEQTLRGLPLTHFSRLEKVLQDLDTCFSKCSLWNRMGRHWVLRDLSTCSRERLKAYLMILSTPGCNYANPKAEDRYLLSAIGDEDVDDTDWKPDYAHAQDVAAEEAREKLARAREQAEWINLQHAVQSLPLDLNLLIRDTMLEEIFGPGKEIVFPYEGPTYVQHFRALDRQLYHRYSCIYYCQNTWVFGEGYVSWLIEHGKLAIPRVLSKIRNVNLKWTWRDVVNNGPARPDIQKHIDWEMKMAGAEGFDNIKVMQRFQWTCTKVTTELQHIWLEKLREIGSMQLDHLVIDAREAFAPDGEFLGLKAARRWTKSMHLPYYLEIWAPVHNEDLAEQIFQIITRRYS